MICENAVSQILMSKSPAQFGLIRASIPMPAPGKVNENMTMIAMIMNTNGIKIFDASPIPLSMDLWEMKW